MNKQEQYFDTLYDQFIEETDTQVLLENISVEKLEAFLYQTAKYFFWAHATEEESGDEQF